MGTRGSPISYRDPDRCSFRPIALGYPGPAHAITSGISWARVAHEMARVTYDMDGGEGRVHINIG